MEHYHMDRTSLIKLYLVSQAIALILGFGFLLYCPQVNFSGVTQGQPVVKSIYQLDDLKVDCNSHCHCGDEYEPVCGNNKVQVRNSQNY
jgi:hypothetical protein